MMVSTCGRLAPSAPRMACAASPPSSWQKQRRISCAASSSALRSGSDASHSGTSSAARPALSRSAMRCTSSRPMPSTAFSVRSECSEQRASGACAMAASLRAASAVAPRERSLPPNCAAMPSPAAAADCSRVSLSPSPSAPLSMCGSASWQKRLLPSGPPNSIRSAITKSAAAWCGSSAACQPCTSGRSCASITSAISAPCWRSSSRTQWHTVSRISHSSSSCSSSSAAASSSSSSTAAARASRRLASRCSCCLSSSMTPLSCGGESSVSPVSRPALSTSRKTESSASAGSSSFSL
mmetsp:Transcript_33047/g.78146  ORF Transcript_33047/g.78146 Transcript_33047/m.78146 type:complete len:296 (+) Transcript_33047:393-1280(+)